MPKLIYTPDQDVKVHGEGAIRLICKAYQSHESGMPEWLKNSADAYAREDAPEAKRVIVCIFDFGRRGVDPSISCLDFEGMSSKVIEENFRFWADPDAARRGAGSSRVQGGHGNGGKCYMTQMFDAYAMLQTIKKGKGNCYGVIGGSIRFGYIPDRQRGRDFPGINLPQELDRVLRPLRCSIEMLPQEAKKALVVADGFTLVTGASPKGYSNRIPVRELVESLQEHPQMITTLEICKVFVIVNGELFNQGLALALPEITPMEGAEAPRTAQIPVLLKDPAAGRQVNTTNNETPPGTLTLRTSNVSMRWSKKGRHNIVFKGRTGYIGYVPVSELDIQSPYRDRIYGECHLEALEPFKQNERGRLATSPLTRAVERFISAQVQEYAAVFEARDRRAHSQQEKDALSKMNEALDRWKNGLLSELMQGLWGPGGTGPPPPPPPLPTGKLARLELSFSHPQAGLGVAFRPTLKFFDEGGRRIRPMPVRWVSEDTNVAMVDEEIAVINTFSYGQTGIHAETIDGKIKSNRVPLEVVRILNISILPSQLEIAVGNRQKLDAVCQLANIGGATDVYLEWTEDNPKIARVSAAGLVFGFMPGETKVVAGDDKCLAKEPALIKVVPGKGRGPGGQPGSGYPTVLLSEVQNDPETEGTVSFSREDPPVVQRPQDVDRNIWWINSAAPFARMYLDEGRGFGYGSREWRIYHVERYIDILVQIAFTHGPTEQETLSVGDWILRWGAQVADVQAAAAAGLREFIATGNLPEG